MEPSLSASAAIHTPDAAVHLQVDAIVADAIFAPDQNHAAQHILHEQSRVEWRWSKHAIGCSTQGRLGCKMMPAEAIHRKRAKHVFRANNG